MPAVTVPDLLILPRISRPDAATAHPRPVARVIQARTAVEGEGFVVRRPFPGGVSLHDVDPFLLLDHMGEVDLAPGEAKGTPWHPHRGFETVTYLVDGALEHRDSTGGGGVITDGATQWMTAGGGIQHIEQPTSQLLTNGGVLHGVQLWVNLPAKQKMTTPRYQDITADSVRLLASHDGGTLVRLIAGDLGGHAGPGATWTPIIYAHATLEPGAVLEVPWPAEFSAMAYVLSGSGRAGTGDRSAPLTEAHLALFGAGDSVVVSADEVQSGRSPKLEVLLLGGLPIREPIVHYGPFVMNTRAEILTAIDDFEAGRLGQIPASGR